MPAFKIKKGQPTPSVADFAVGGMATAAGGNVSKVGQAALKGLKRVIPDALLGSLGFTSEITQHLPTAPRPQAPQLVGEVLSPNRWMRGRQPKPGGVLNEVLSRASEKSGMGDALTPGERGLVNQFKTWSKK